MARRVPSEIPIKPEGLSIPPRRRTSPGFEGMVAGPGFLKPGDGCDAMHPRARTNVPPCPPLTGGVTEYRMPCGTVLSACSVRALVRAARGAGVWPDNGEISRRHAGGWRKIRVNSHGQWEYCGERAMGAPVQNVAPMQGGGEVFCQQISETPQWPETWRPMWWFDNHLVVGATAQIALERAEAAGVWPAERVTRMLAGKGQQAVTLTPGVGEAPASWDRENSPANSRAEAEAAIDATFLSPRAPERRGLPLREERRGARRWQETLIKDLKRAARFTLVPAGDEWMVLHVRPEGAAAMRSLRLEEFPRDQRVWIRAN